MKAYFFVLTMALGWVGHWSFPWVVNGRGYCAFLMTENLNNRGRQDREMELVRLVDAAL